VPEEGGAHLALPDAVLGGRVLAHQREHGVVLRPEERGVDDALDARGHGGVDGVEVLLQPVLGLRGRHQVQRVHAVQRGPEAGGVGVATGVLDHLRAGDGRGAPGVPYDQPEGDVAGSGQPLEDPAAECSGDSCDSDHAAPASGDVTCGIMTPSNLVRPRLLPGGTPCASAS
jgi:hypothetical protein